MTDVLEYVLDGLAAALELERELGVRAVEFDRSLLTPVVTANGGDKAPGVPPVQAARTSLPRCPSASPAVASTPSVPSPQPKQPRNSDNQTISRDLVFLHDRPLSPSGVEMMAKIVTALGRTPENAPIVVVPPAPRAKVIVVLGGRAMKLYFPEMRGEPGQWQKSPSGDDVLITYSPEYILRFGTVTPAVQKLKQDMWRCLKAVVQRLK